MNEVPSFTELHSDRRVRQEISCQVLKQDKNIGCEMGFKGSKMRSREWGCASPGEVQGGPLKEAIATASVRILETWSVEALGLGVDA